jgi:diketogulonate reductase-like aldo/keto reductase
MGEDPRKRQKELNALRLGLELGLRLIDTAEMYGEGAAEVLVGEAIEGHRDEVFLVSKIYPFNASEKGTPAACERSLRRLNTDYLDLYLLHWKGSIPLSETLEAFQLLKRAGKILEYGVSNFDTDDMKEASTLPGGKDIATNQVLYNLKQRGIEWDLLPWCRKHKMPVMAYSPIEHNPRDQHGMLDNPHLQNIASRHSATPAQIALAWLLHQQDIVAIPKAGNEEHVRQNRQALDIQLTPEDLAIIDKAFPPPKKKMPLAIR